VSTKLANLGLPSDQSDIYSVMEKIRATDVKLTTQSALSARERSRKTKYIRKGKLNLSTKRGVTNGTARYVEMLEQQQSQLVAGVRQMYRKLLNGEIWPGLALPEQQDGFPLTHDILERLNVLHMTGENPVGLEAFENNLEKLQQRISSSTQLESELVHTDTAGDERWNIHGVVQQGIGIDTYNSTKRNIIRGQPDEFGDRGLPDEILRWCGID
jgi:hypothetical protein